MKDPVLTGFLLRTFGLSFAGGVLQFHATSRLAKWLYHHRREICRELGRPGTTFFKGDPDNTYLSRTTALNQMQRMIPLHDYQRQLADGEAARYLYLHRLYGGLSAVFMALFFVGIFYGVFRYKRARGRLCERDRS
jgi:hypothetical protein